MAVVGSGADGVGLDGVFFLVETTGLTLAIRRLKTSLHFSSDANCWRSIFGVVTVEEFGSPPSSFAVGFSSNGLSSTEA